MTSEIVETILYNMHSMFTYGPHICSLLVQQSDDSIVLISSVLKIYNLLKNEFIIIIIHFDNGHVQTILNSNG